MRCALVLSLVLFVASGLASDDVEGRYIVVFKKGLAAATHEDHVARYFRNLTSVVQHSIGTFRAYSAKISEDVLPLITKSTEVDYVERDGIATAMKSACFTDTGLPAGLWGLTRINQRVRDLNGQYTFYDTTRNLVRAYVLDTGIRLTHTEFSGGRAVFGANFADNVETDENGHGTHVASTICGRMYGVSKTTTAVSVKVLGKSGSTTWTAVIQGLQWTSQDAAKYRNTNPVVGVMAIGGARNQAVNDAVDAAHHAGVGMVVSAGGSNGDACQFTPASAPTAFTVGGSTNTDARSSSSNWGRCLSAWAPGQNILGAWISTDTSSQTLSGTSMSAGYACGVLANALASTPHHPPMPPAEAFAVVKANATTGVITDGKEAQGTPNLLVYAACSD